MANKPGDQGAPGGGTPSVWAPNTAENDAEFDIGTIWPALHLSNRRSCAPMSANTTELTTEVPTQQFVRASFKGQRKPQTGPVHSNQALQPVKVLPPTTAVGPSKSVGSEQSKAESHENESTVNHNNPV
jgi:hypothetical protein